jgi:hypothetical protein
MTTKNQYGIRLPYHEANLLLKRAKRESKTPTTVATELVCKGLRRKWDPIPNAIVSPEIPLPSPLASPPPMQPTAMVPLAAAPPIQPESPPPPPVVIPAISIFPTCIQKAVVSLAGKAHLSNERVLIELIGSMLGILTEETALLMVTGDAGFGIEDLVKVMGLISAGTLKPVVSSLEFEAELNTAKKAPTITDLFPPPSSPSPPTPNGQF